MSPQPRNAFHQNLAIIEGRQREIDKHLGELKDVIPTNVGMTAVLTRMATAGEAQAAAAKEQAEAAKKMAEATQHMSAAIVAQVNLSQDAPAIALYICGMKCNGHFDEYSLVGRLLIDACGKRTDLAALVPGKRKPYVQREKFRAVFQELIKERGSHLADIWHEPDLDRFWRLAPYVLALLDRMPPQRPEPTSDPSASA